MKPDKSHHSKKSAIVWLLGFGSLFLLLAGYCSKPTEPPRFVRIELQIFGNPDSAAYTGVPIQITAELDSAVPFGEIQWNTGKGIQHRRELASDDTTSTDTIWVTWDELPSVPYARSRSSVYTDSDTTPAPPQPLDTIWAEYKGSRSNEVIVSVLNRAPKIDSVIVNGRLLKTKEDTIPVSGNHSTIAYILVYASDPDTSSRLDIGWVQKDSVGRLVSKERVTAPSQFSGTRGPYKWEIQWEALPVDRIGDTTVVTTASIRVADRSGGHTEIPLRIVIYRESGSVWVASTGENTSTLVKYSDNGKELFRIPGYEHINALAVDPTEEKVWFTDKSQGKVHCVDDDGNLEYELSGFRKPMAIAVHDLRGYACVADEDTGSTPTSRIRVFSKDENGKLDTSATLKVPGGITSIAFDHTRLTNLIVSWVSGSGGDSTDYITQFTSFWKNKGDPVRDVKNPVSVEINPVTQQAWVADNGNNRVIRIDLGTLENTFTRAITGFLNPKMISVNSRDSSCWVADTDNNRVVRIAPDVPDGYDAGTGIASGTSYHIQVTDAFGIDFNQPRAIAVNPHEKVGDEGRGVVWAAEWATVYVAGITDQWQRMQVDFDDFNAVSWAEDLSTLTD